MLPVINNQTTEPKKPAWFKIRPPKTEPYLKVREVLRKHGLVTVCEEAHCPNIAECWSGGTATFMVMGDTCTRGCKFCAIKTASKGKPLDPEEPKKLSDAVDILKLSYVVITSVDRDDLPDGGAGHFAECIRVCQDNHPGLLVEVLISDFAGDKEALKKVVDAQPAVIAHNIETTRALQKKVRDLRAGYEQSLKVLKDVKEMDPNIYTKSSIMLGLGETTEDVVQTMKDLRAIGCEALTIGQYLKPKNKFLKVEEYVHPSKFEEFKKIGEDLGFLYVAAGPFVRSSYRAGELYLAHLNSKNDQSERLQSA